jgi:hypothetical protein
LIDKISYRLKTSTGRPDVDKAVTTIPEQLKGCEIAEKASAEQVSAIAAESGKKDNTSEKSMDEGNDTNEDEEVPSKKTKLDSEFNVFTLQLLID